MSIMSARRVEIPVLESPLASVKGSGPSWLRPASIEKLVLAGDIILVVLSGFGCAIAYHLSNSGSFILPNVFAAVSVMIAINFGLLVTVQQGYELTKLADYPRVLRMVSITWTALFGGLLAIAFGLKISSDFSRATALSFYGVGMLVMAAWRAFAAKLISKALRKNAFANIRSLVIAEAGLPASSQAMQDLGQHGYWLIRSMEIPSNQLASPGLLSTLAPRFEELVSFSRENRIEHVFLQISWSRKHAIEAILDVLKILPVPVHLLPDANVAHFLRQPLQSTGSTSFAELRRAPLSLKECAVKRGLDFAGALFALIVFAPVLLLAGIMVMLTSEGPVLFRQTRNGFGGRTFKILKFRTMRVLEDGPTILQAQKNDPRVTTIGRWLRKTSIDELPQLFNVVIGDMSLVGPRPHAAAHNNEYEQIISSYAFRHHVKPGITGWAQVNGYRGETHTLQLMEKRVEHDLWYINNWSIWLDLKILIRTAFLAFGRSSAY